MQLSEIKYTWNERRREESVEENVSAAGLVQLAAECQLFDERSDAVVLGLVPDLGQDLLAQTSHLLVAGKTENIRT